MAQDIRDMFRDEEAPQASERLREGHEKRFEARLDEAFPKKASEDKNYIFLKIAAILVVALGIGLFFFNRQDPYSANPVADTPADTVAPAEQEQEKGEVQEKQFQLSDVSPQFKKIENYYLGSLNVELAKLDVNKENKALIDAFMEQLSELDKEYKRLNSEFDKGGANEQTVEAMIANLQLRLELLFKLKKKLKEINQTKNDSYENHQA